MTSPMRVSRSQIGKIFDKTEVFYLFEALTCDKKNLKWIFFSDGNYETCYMFYIPCSGT